MRKKSKLDLQCDEVGWPLNTTHGYYVGSGKWSFDEIISCGPEEFVAAQLAAVAFRCCWCEGGSLNLLMKAAALDVLVRRNIFGDRESSAALAAISSGSGIGSSKRRDQDTSSSLFFEGLPHDSAPLPLRSAGFSPPI